MKKYAYTCVTYAQDVVLLVGKWSHIAAYVDREFSVALPMPQADDAGNTLFLDVANPGSPIAIWLPAFNCYDPGDIGLLAHECVHVVSHMLETRLVHQSPRDKNREIVAYPLQELMTGLLAQVFARERHRPRRRIKKTNAVTASLPQA